MESLLGEIRTFPYGFIPANWALCNGHTLQIVQSPALFSLLGTTFGGDGRSSFGLPNLNGSLAVGTGQSSAGSNWQLGQSAGSTGVTLSPAQMPPHSHALTASTAGADSRSAAGNQLAAASQEVDDRSYDALIYVNAAPDITLASGTLGNAGGNQPHDNTMPSLALVYCIALQGLFPTFD